MDEQENVRELLNEEIAEELKALDQLDFGTKEHSEAISNIVALYRLRIDENRIEYEADDKYNQRIFEQEKAENQLAIDNELREYQRAVDEESKTYQRTVDEASRKQQCSDTVKDRYVRIGIAAAELTIPLIFYGIWMKKGFRFEETGTYTSTTFRGLFNRFRPTTK